MSDMVEVVIDSIRVHLMAPQRVLVLKQTDAARYLTIWVGPYEAEAITIALQEVEVARPLTHDLLKNIFTAFNARIIRIEIIKLQDDIFYGNIIAEADGQRNTDRLAPIGCDCNCRARACAHPRPCGCDGCGGHVA